MNNSTSAQSASESGKKDQKSAGFNPPAAAARAARYEPLFPADAGLYPRIQGLEEAVKAAEKCRQCTPPAPCILSCPLHINIPAALKSIQQNEIEKAASIFRARNPFAEVCGRLCTQNLVCQKACNQVCGDNGPPINLLEEYVSYKQRESGQQNIEPGSPLNCSIAVVGSGPAGLACTYTLVRSGFDVTVYEKMPLPGGMLRYGIPEYKIPPGWIENYTESLQEAGVTFKTGISVGSEMPVDDLFKQGFSAIFIASGCNVDNIPDIPGVDLPGVCLASDFIARARIKPQLLPQELQLKPPLGIRIIVLGGGNTAMDCLRAAFHIGSAEVTCIFEKNKEAMTGSSRMRMEAKEAGARFRYMTKPIQFIPDPQGNVSAVECLHCELGSADKNGLRDSVPIPGSNFLLRADTIVLAMGVHPDPTIGNTTPGLETHAGGLIIVDPETRNTSRTRIFAGGDAVRGPDLVVSAVADGISAAHAIKRSLISST